MTVKNLKDLYLDQLVDLYSACRQSMPIVTELGRVAKRRNLIDALIDGNKGIARGMEAVGTICSTHNVDPTTGHCYAMEGILVEAKRQAIEGDFADEDAQDAAIIAQYQRMAHYAIASLGCVRTFANRLGFPDDAAILQESLDHTWNGDQRMTQIAEGGVNHAALDGQ